MVTMEGYVIRLEDHEGKGSDGQQKHNRDHGYAQQCPLEKIVYVELPEMDEY